MVSVVVVLVTTVGTLELVPHGAVTCSKCLSTVSSTSGPTRGVAVGTVGSVSYLTVVLGSPISA